MVGLVIVSVVSLHKSVMKKDYISFLLEGKEIAKFRTLSSRESEFHPWYPIFPFNSHSNDFYLPARGELILSEGACPIRELAEAVGFSCYLKGDSKHDLNIDLGYPRSKIMLLGDKEVIRATYLNYIYISPVRCGQEFISGMSMQYILDEDNDGFFDAIDGTVLKSPGA